MNNSDVVILYCWNAGGGRGGDGRGDGGGGAPRLEAGGDQPLAAGSMSRSINSTRGVQTWS